MPDEKNNKTIIARTRFLVVDSEAAVGEGLRRFLLSQGAPAVHVAPSTIIALRILQDRRTPVDCVICAHRPEALSGVEFLTNLRAGRWGGVSLQHISFILLMPARDAQVMAIADNMKVSGYILGKMDKDNVRQSILQALDPKGMSKALPNFKIAHIRAGERDLILAPFPPSFGRLRADKQQQALQAVAAGAQREALSGAVAAVYDDNGKTAFVAPAVYERFLSRLTVATVNTMLNRAIYVEWIGDDPSAETGAADAAEDSLEPLPLFEEDEDEKKEEEAADRRRAASKTERQRARGLTEDDIRGVAKAFKDMGPEEFVGKFVRHQAILLQSESQFIAPTMREFYVSIDLLRKSFFPGVEMRGSKR